MKTYKERTTDIKDLEAGRFLQILLGGTSQGKIPWRYYQPETSILGYCTWAGDKVEWTINFNNKGNRITIYKETIYKEMRFPDTHYYYEWNNELTRALISSIIARPSVAYGAAHILTPNLNSFSDFCNYLERKFYFPRVLVTYFELEW